VLSESELIRYRRQIIDESMGEKGQEKLKASKIIIIGAGGLGGPVIFYLAASGVGHITICDSDQVELSNLNRQILHNNKKIGVKKTDSAAETVRLLNPEIDVTPLSERIEERNAGDILRGYDLIIDCMDNFESRQVINSFCVEKSMPLIHAGVSRMQGQLTFIHPPETACLSCFLPHEDIKVEIPILGATAGIMGSIQALEAVKYLTGTGTCLKNRLLFMDGETMNFHTINLAKNPACKTCSE
jgi:molybdopterin-synthase adenylyltransferase